MSFTDDLLTGFARLLVADVDPAQNLDWQPTGAYPTDKTGLYMMALPLDANRAVALAPYPLTDDPSLSDSQIGIQVRSRSAASDPRDVFALDDAIADALLGNYPVDLATGVRICTLVRSSSTSLGQDDNYRWQWASSFTAGLWRPSPHRI